MPMSEPSTPIRRIVVDTDTGIDDALALLYLAGRPDVDLVQVTTVYGNCEVDRAVENVARVLRVAGLEDVPVARGAEHALDGSAHIGSYVHGEDGMGDVYADRLTPRNLVETASAETLVELANQRPGELDLLTLGPLTNVGRALELDPELLTKFRSTAFMGGSGPFPPPGVQQSVDPNISNDVEAATRVFTAPRRHLVSVGMNVTMTTVLDEAAIEVLARSDSAWGAFAVDILQQYLDFYQYTWGRRICPVHDGLAAALLVQPEWITASEWGPMHVVTDGYSVRGRLARTPDGMPPSWPLPYAPDTQVVTDVDRRAFLADFVRVLTQRP